MTRNEVNEQLEYYTNKFCSSCYAQITDTGEIKLDGEFSPVDFIAIVHTIDELYYSDENDK